MMLFDYETLKFIWFIIIGLLFVAFAITGGADFGVGILLPIVGKTDEERRILLNSIGPTWEGNQVWLITAAAALFAAWPVLYATAFSSLYLALFVVVLALVVRPPGFDYRGKLPSSLWRSCWDLCFFLSGLVPSFIFGVALGNVFVGLPFYFDENMQSHFTGNLLSLLTPVPLWCGILSILAAVLQGSVFLQLKTEALVQVRSRKATYYTGGLLLFVFAVVCYCVYFKVQGVQVLNTPDHNIQFSPPMKGEVIQAVGAWQINYHHYPLGLLAPLLSVGCILACVVFSYFNCLILSFLTSSVALTAIFATAWFSLFPVILPSSTHPLHSITIWDACSSQLSLMWMLVAVIVFLPVVLGYTAWVYVMMRGKVNAEGLKQGSESY